MDYWLHLQRNDIDPTAYGTYDPQHTSKADRKRTTLLLIPQVNISMMWTDLIPVKGNMTFSVCDREFTSEQEMLLWYNQSIDTRARPV